MTTDTEALRAQFEAWFSGGFPRSSDGRILGMWPDSGMPLKLIEFARCVEAAHGIGVKGRLSEWRCMKESKK